MSQYFDTGT